MADRTVKVRLVGDVSDYTAALAKAAAATRGLGKDVEKAVDRDIAPAMSRSGEKSGGLLARGINQGVVRNSPLIVAGVAAALAAGAPAALAGAAVLFGGIGGLAAAQTVEVREAWTELGHDIRDGAVRDASVLAPVYVEMADKIGAAFRRMRPEIRDAFEASAPHIDRFTDGLTGAAENALPGLVRAVERGGPVIDGLATLMEDIGTGLSDFLDAMSDNSGAAGQALEGLGDALGAAMPLLGELLGTGAEIATDVLPAVASALGLVHGVVKALGPALGPIVTGFIAFKAASTAAGFLNTFSMAAQRAGVASAGVTTAMSGASKAMPLLAIATMGVTTAIGKGEEGERRFEAAVMDATRRLGEGGAEGRKAAHELEVLKQVAEESGGKFLGMGADMEGAFKRGQQAALDLAGAEDTLALATEAATAAMSEQAAMAAAAANSDLAYRMSVDATEDAVAALSTAIAEHGAASEEASDAALQVESAMLRQAEAARQSAFDTSKATSEAGRNAEADAAMLAELLRLQSTMGSSFPAALNTTIGRLQGTTNAGMVAAAQFDNLGLSILRVPNSKTVIVSSTTPEQIRLLESLGFKVTHLPNGTVQVTAMTSAAENAINYAARNRTSTIHVQTSFGSNPNATYMGQMPARASGGPVWPNQPFLVGEKGPELVQFGASGFVTPADMTQRALASGREVSGASGGSFAAPGIDYARLGDVVASALASRPAVGTIVTDRNETGFELAEKLTFDARTRG